MNVRDRLWEVPASCDYERVLYRIGRFGSRVAVALARKELPEVFDNVIDSELFHVFSDEDRRHYVEGLASVPKPCGRLYFSDDEPGEHGPRPGVEERDRGRLRRGLGRGEHLAVPVRGPT